MESPGRVYFSSLGSIEKRVNILYKMVAKYVPRIIWWVLSEIKPGNNRGEKLLDAWLNKSMTIEKLKTIIDIRPPIQALKTVNAVSPLLLPMEWEITF